MRRWLWLSGVVLGLGGGILLGLPAQQDHPSHDFPVVPLTQKTGPLQKALSLLREGKTADARQELEANGIAVNIRRLEFNCY
jgi:hypothetical protein